MDHEELEVMVEDILKREEKLTEWEREFISDVQFKTSFSPRQADIINKIWDRIT